MASLKKIAKRFEVPLTVVEGGSGTLSGMLVEPSQLMLQDNVFINPRRVLRVDANMPVQAGMVVRTPAGMHYLVGSNAPTERPGGSIANHWWLFEASAQVSWKQRTKVIDAVTQLERDDGYTDPVLIWAAYEPLDRQVLDRRMSVNFPQARLLTGRDVQPDDVIEDRKVTLITLSLGVKVITLT